MFSLTSILTRSATAAGQAIMSELEGYRNAAAVPAESVPGTPGGATPAGAATAGATAPTDTANGVAAVSPEMAGVPTPPQSSAQAAAPGATPAPGATAATAVADPQAPVPVARPAFQLDAGQIDILAAATSAVVAVNHDGHAPQLTSAVVAWTGGDLRFATLGWSRRTTMIRSDRRVGLLVEGSGDGQFLIVTGQATIAEGRNAREAMWPLLLREVGDGREDAAEARWQELVASDPDRAVIIVEPDQVLSARR